MSHQCRSYTLTLEGQLHYQSLDIARAFFLITAHRANDIAACDGFEKNFGGKIGFNLVERLRQRRDGEIIVELRLALIRDLLQFEDGFCVFY